VFLQGAIGQGDVAVFHRVADALDDLVIEDIRAQVEGALRGEDRDVAEQHSSAGEVVQHAVRAGAFEHLLPDRGAGIRLAGEYP